MHPAQTGSARTDRTGGAKPGPARGGYTRPMSEANVYRLYPPDPRIADLVDCFWVVEDPDPVPRERKIIPDGFPELVFHYGDPYEIRLDDDWERQPRSLAAGQISRYFFLRNTGRSAMVGVKLQPWALAHLSGRRMDALRDRVVALREVCDDAAALETAALSTGDAGIRIAALADALRKLRPVSPPPAAVMRAVRTIFDAHGALPVADICARIGTHERSLERAFARHIGLTPKFYSRVIRFSAIFKAARGEGPSLSDLSFHAGYYDQPHFHRNFKAFTGESPSGYPFAQASMANLFLNRP